MKRAARRDARGDPRRAPEGAARRRRRTRGRRLLTAFASVCLAVDFAHARGVLHRDLKPGNIMLGDFGEVYVLDWGLAKLTSAEGAGRRSHLQARAQKRDPGRRGDGHAGLHVARAAPRRDRPARRRAPTSTRSASSSSSCSRSSRCTTGRGSTPSTTRRSASSPMRLSERAFARGVPPELVAICVRATALDRGERYASARELHDAIERFLDGEPRRQGARGDGRGAREDGARGGRSRRQRCPRCASSRCAR